MAGLLDNPGCIFLPDRSLIPWVRGTQEGRMPTAEASEGQGTAACWG
jgi:hypothetical protein